MAVIPQDSFVFSGSLRFNIDPFQEFEDLQIQQILSTVRFFETLKKSSNEESESKLDPKKPGPDSIEMSQFETREANRLMTQTSEEEVNQLELLDWNIEDGGSNLSIGQKQLICIARALIKKPQILLMDEATSNIDEYTDSLIQTVIQKQFRDTTIGTLFCLTPSDHCASAQDGHALRPHFCFGRR